MSFHTVIPSVARNPYCNHTARARAGIPRGARNDTFGACASRVVGLLAVLLLLSSSPLAHAATTLTGTVTNGTTGKPAAGNEVILLKLSEGMQEEARTKSDAQGRFELPVSSPDVAHLVRVIHQKVNYHRPAPPGTNSVEVQIFDSAPKLEGITATVDVMRVQAQPDSLDVTEMFALKNESNPPRTLMSDRTFEISLPEAAQIQGAIAAGPGGMPVNSAPVPSGKGRYGFIFPLRPGETRFQVTYRMPYSGEAEFKPHMAYKVQDFAVMLPKSMQFTPAAPGTFSLADDQPGFVVEMAKNVGPGPVTGFRVKGTGTMPEETAAGEQAGEQAPSGAPDTRPGGGIGRPSELPDPLHAYRWYIFGGLAGVMALGAFWLVNRQQQPLPGTAHNLGVAASPVARPAGGSMLLEALKEELFQLETERLQQKISQEEYAKTKAALDLTLQRALSRKNNS